MQSSQRIACPARLTADMREDHWATELIIMMLHRLQKDGCSFQRKRNPTRHPPDRVAPREWRSVNATTSASPSRRFQAAALDLGAVAGREQHEGFGIARLRCLARAGMGSLGAVVLGRGVDAVALLKMLLLHPPMLSFTICGGFCAPCAAVGCACIAMASPIAVDSAEAANRRRFMISHLFGCWSPPRPTAG